MLRFDARKGFYFYPSTNNMREKRLWVNEGSTYEKNVKPREDMCVVKMGLVIPKCLETYEEFVQQVKTEELVFKRTLSNNIRSVEP